jgi:hypothetical protein
VRADALLAAAAPNPLPRARRGVPPGRDGDIDCVLVETKSGRLAIRARAFIDCSGDADLAHWSGAPLEKGDDAGHLLYPTLMFRSATWTPRARARRGVRSPR